MNSVHHLPPPTTTTKRIRRKTREVSSRYMTTPAPSPLVSSSSHNTKFRGTSSINSSSPESSDAESEFANENFPPPSSRSLRTPLPFNTQTKALGTQRKASIRLFGDNEANSSVKARPATPFSPKGTILSNTHVRNVRDNAKNGSVTSRVFSVKSDGTFSDNSSVVSDSDFENRSVGKNGGFCDTPINGSRFCRNQNGVRNSMPETDKLAPMSARRILIDPNENHISNSSVEGPACRRSLNLGISINQQNMCQNKKGRHIPSKLCLPPLKPSSRLDGEVKKGSRLSRKQEDIHMLKLLENRYLQWRFINAMAKEAGNSRTIGAEKSLYGVSDNIVEMRNVVIQKRIEVARLRRMQSLSYILESQKPFLNDYSNLEEDYSSSLTGVTNALNDCLVKLPTTEDVKADVNELKVVFDETLNIFNSLSPNVQRCIPTTEDIKDVESELAAIASIERALVKECGNLLSEAHNLQVIECSLRGQLIQGKPSCGL